MTGTAGNKGDYIRSDCYVSVELAQESGIEINLRSKVASLYGDSIRNISLDILNFFEIQHAKVTIEDKGALDFVIAARLESAIKEVVSSEKEYLLPLTSENTYHTDKDKPRRSRLYIPGNSPKLMINAGIHSADGVILDLEDSVAPDKKNEARYLVRNALRSVNFYDAERMVRINQIPEGMNDLKYIVPHNVNLILLPKCETAAQIKQVDEEISQIAKKSEHQIHLMPIIESALGVINAYSIATASENIAALAIGLEDYTADIGAKRSEGGKESFYARSTIVNAASAAGIQAIDSVYSDVSNMDGLRENVANSKALGFVGMGCIHPRQVRIINTGFNPGQAEIEKAKAIVLAYEEAQRKGSGVTAIGSKMIDLPIVKRALTTLNTALSSGLLKENWRESENE
ncbi:Citrate lyase acyl carrier protein [subsurface metagenome]